MRRNPGHQLRDLRKNPDGKSGFVRKIRMWNAEKSGPSPRGSRKKSGCEMVNPDCFGDLQGDCTDLSKISGCEMWRNPGNCHGDVRICPDAKWGKILFCLLACCCCLLNKVLEHFRICNSGFIRMFDAEKSGQSPQGSLKKSGCEIRICPDGIYKK